MVTILRPHRHKHDESLSDITGENPGNVVRPDGSTGAENGTELSEDDADEGTASAPGEGPNPTA